MPCDVCGLPDIHNGQGDGIGSCDCPRCEGGCGVAAGSDLCTCPAYDPTDETDYWDDDLEPAGDGAR